MKKIVIAIDGPAGSGKSTIAKILAEKLGIKYLDTGAMFRAIALKLKEKNIDISNTHKLKDCLNNTSINFVNGMITLDGKAVEEFIRTPEITKLVTPVSQNKYIRDRLLQLQRGFAENESIVMDGRDIGTVVLPDADVKIFLTASVDVRAERRYKQLLNTKNQMDFDYIKKDIERRDLADSQRNIAPLKAADDAIIIDSSNMSIEDVANRIISFIK